MAVPRGEVLVSSVDALVEGVHFRLDWSTPDSVGRKAIAVSLSDLAAMGAAPRAMLVSLTLPAAFPLADFDALVDGLVEEAAVMARRWRAATWPRLLAALRST